MRRRLGDEDMTQTYWAVLHLLATLAAFEAVASSELRHLKAFLTTPHRESDHAVVLEEPTGLPAGSSPNAPSQHNESVCNVLTFGASGLRSQDSTSAFRRAVAACAAQRRPGTIAEVVVPAGQHSTGPFNLTSHMKLNVREGATIYAMDDFLAYPLLPPLPSYGSGREFPVRENNL